MSAGRLIAVVGPSGVGKDSVMRGIHDVMPELHLVRRVITRSPDLGGEDYDAVTVPEFKDMADNGAFVVYWRAHGLYYGIPQTVRYHLNKGTHCLANFSRKALSAGADAFPGMIVLNITARPETLAARLTERGRESEAEIAKRLGESQKPLPADQDIIHLANDGPLEHTIACAMTLLHPMSV